MPILSHQKFAVPNAATHRAGAVVAMSASLALEANTDSKFDAIEALTSILIARGAASLPDWLEPATSPNHRQLFHSWLALGGVGLLLRWLHRWQPDDPLMRLVRLAGKAVCIAYLAHLALDALTPRSLPLIGRV